MDIKSLSDQELEKLNRKLKAKRGLEDLYYFNTVTLGHDKATRNTHGELLKLVTEWDKQKKSFMTLLPRGTFKTELVTEGYTLQKILKNPNLTVYLFGETYTKMVKYATAMKAHLLSQSITDLYGWQKDEHYWKEDGFKVSGRTRIAKEPTLTVGGIDKPATGMHFDLIVCDDVIGETNTETADQLEKSKRRFEELSSLLNPGGMIIVVGTIWDEDDLYCDIITKKEGFTDWNKLLADRIYVGRDWNVYIRRAKDPDGTYFFPERLGKEALEKIERSQSSFKHKCQFYNDPQRTGIVIFKDEWRRAAKDGFDSVKRDAQGMIEEVTEEWIVIDPAISKNPQADFSAIEVFGIGKDDRRFIIEGHQERLDELELLNAIFSIVDRRRKVKGIIVETYGFQKIIFNLIQAEKIKRGKYLKLIDANPGTKQSKESRIELIVPRMREGRLFYSRDFVELDMQFRKFPNLKKSDHDDALDCVSIAELAIPERRAFDPTMVWPEDMAEDVPRVSNTCGI